MKNPSATLVVESGGPRVALAGAWTLEAGARLEDAALRLSEAPAGAAFDLSALEGLDTAGAWVVSRARAQLDAAGRPARLAGLRPEYATLLREAAYAEPEIAPAPPRGVAGLSPTSARAWFAPGRAGSARSTSSAARSPASGGRRCIRASGG